MFSRYKRKERKRFATDQNIPIYVAELAEKLVLNGLGDSFRELAKKTSEKISPSFYSQLEGLLHSPPDEPESTKGKWLGLGQWMAACQFAIFEILYNLGEKSLPVIRKIAWGEYDWTQGNALELLIRFAASGIQRNEIIIEFKEKFPEIREEAKLYTIRPLLGELKKNEALQEIFTELLKINEFKEAYDEAVGEQA